MTRFDTPFLIFMERLKSEGAHPAGVGGTPTVEVSISGIVGEKMIRVVVWCEYFAGGHGGIWFQNLFLCKEADVVIMWAACMAA